MTAVEMGPFLMVVIIVVAGFFWNQRLASYKPVKATELSEEERQLLRDLPALYQRTLPKGERIGQTWLERAVRPYVGGYYRRVCFEIIQLDGSRQQAWIELEATSQSLE